VEAVHQAKDERPRDPLSISLFFGLPVCWFTDEESLSLWAQQCRNPCLDLNLCLSGSLVPWTWSIVQSTRVCGTALPFSIAGACKNAQNTRKTLTHFSVRSQPAHIPMWHLFHVLLRASSYLLVPVVFASPFLCNGRTLPSALLCLRTCLPGQVCVCPFWFSHRIGRR
jgi:hypothetical protein